MLSAMSIYFFLTKANNGAVVKNLPANAGFDPRVRKIPWSRKWQLTPVLLPGESHGQRNLVGYIVHGVRKSQTQLSDCAHPMYTGPNKQSQ